MNDITFKPAILYVDDEQLNLDTFKRAFGSDYLVQTAPSAGEALQILTKEDFPIVVADQRMPGMTGIELCEKLIEIRPQTIRMILTAFTETKTLLNAINRGHVHDYIVKPWKRSELMPIFEKAFEDYKQKIKKIEELELRVAENETLKEQIRQTYDDTNIIGAQTSLKGIMEIVQQVAKSNSTVLITGETGTGKELMARAIHDLSDRKQGPFVPVDCASLVSTLLESELFGHEKGAFTGADKMRVGRFEVANRGTLFLDEAGNISEEVQVKLLRVIQERKIQRVGGNREIPVDVRLVVATNRNLEELVREKKFREDLFFRLNVISLRLPPLRERRVDIPILAEHFVQKYCRDLQKDIRLSDEAIEQMILYDWPGNIRELENVLERAVLLTQGTVIEPEKLNLNLQSLAGSKKIEPSSGSTTTIRSQLLEKETKKLAAILTKANGNISEAARIMKIPRTTLMHRLKKSHLV